MSAETETKTETETAKQSEERKMSAEFANKTLQDYEVLAVMGNGAFGTCYKVKDKVTGELYAWKGMNYDELDDEQSESLVSEISVLRQLQHPNIVQYYHHLVNREAKSIYIVMECCDGGDLSQLIQKARKQRERFEESYIWRVLFQLCRALQVCHNKIPSGTILHRDIKPANIFLDANGNVKLGDFGLARVLRRDQSFAASFVGTPHYMSPELVKGRQYDRKSDVWAVGCLIYELCALRPPFRGRVFAQLSDNIAHGEFSCIPAVYSQDLQRIIGYMLAVEHEQRPGIEVITRHPLLVRNICKLDGEFPRLIAAGDDFQLPPGLTQLFPDSPELSEQYSFHEDYGQRRLSIGDVFTPDLFYAAKRRINLQQSEASLYESISRELKTEQSPQSLTECVFNEALQQRLHAIRAQEALLQQRALDLAAQEQRVQQKERELQQKMQQLQQQQQQQQCQCKELPPVPPRVRAAPSRTQHDDTYCSIELNETSPTVAKMNLALLTAPKQLNTRRKVSFVPTTVPTAAVPTATVPTPLPMQTSHSSTESADSQASSTRRKSILSLLGLTRSSKAAPKPAASFRPPLAAKLPATQQLPAAAAAATSTVAAAPAALTNMWSKEQKRAAFELLAAMNAAEKQAGSAA